MMSDKFKSKINMITAFFLAMLSIAQVHAEEIVYCSDYKSKDPPQSFINEANIKNLLPKKEGDYDRYCIAAKRFARIKNTFVLIVTRNTSNVISIVEPSADGKSITVLAKSALPKSYACTDVSSDGFGYEEDFAFDFAAYRMTDDRVAFGFRCSGGVKDDEDGSWHDTLLHLFTLSGSSIKPILSLIVKRAGVVPGERRTDGSLSEEPFEEKYTMRVLKTKTNGYFDWKVSGGPTLHWEGERYVSDDKYSWQASSTAILHWDGEKHVCKGRESTCNLYSIFR